MKKDTLKILLEIQRDEAESLKIYTALARKEKNTENKKILTSIADDEKKHYAMLKEITGKDVSARSFRVNFYIAITKILGLTFGLKLMELGEANAQELYNSVQGEYPELHEILVEEEIHEKKLIDMLSEAKLNNMSSVVLGLNDALVELTGALAGFTFAIQDSRTIALIGLITGISASFSMAASEFLAQRHNDGNTTKEALTSSAYTGFAYIITVILLITPYFLINNAFMALGTTLFIALSVIGLFNYYISVVKDDNFKARFLEMALISMGVALISFGIGWFVKTFLGLEV